MWGHYAAAGGSIASGEGHMSELALATIIATFILTAWYALRPRDARPR